MIEKRTINRIKRVLATIKGNAERATPGPWSYNHGHVVKYDGKGGGFDIAAPIYSHSAHYVLGKTTDNDQADYGNMRHIATCHPQTMLQLAADIETLLKECGELP